MSLRYLLQRLGSLLIVLLGVSILTFAIIPLIPGDPARVRLGVQATPETVAAVREQLGLNRPLPVQYGDWLTGIVTRGDFGESLISSRPIAPEIGRRLPATLTLALAALLIGLIIALPLGTLSALRPGSKRDLGASVFSQVGVSVPDFWMGILLILLFAVILDWLPSGGYTDIGDDPIEHLRYMILPAVTLGFSGAGFLARLVRSTMLDVLNEDYVRTAYSKGLPERHVVLGHALRNASIPVMTVIGILLASMLGGAVVIETVFNIPGMGRLLVQSVTRRDYAVVQGAVMTIAAVEVLVMLIVDVLYVFADPRLRHGSK